jgi:hypothetical protein
MAAENIYRGPGPFKTEDKSNTPTPGYTVAKQSMGFDVPKSQLTDTVTVGLSGNGRVRDVDIATVYKGGTTG